MATPGSVKIKIQDLITSANATTGKGDTDLTRAVNNLIDGYGQGGGAEPKLTTLVTEVNGTFTPENGYDGFDKVVVNTPKSTFMEMKVTKNGVYDPKTYGKDGFNKFTVDVPEPSGNLEITENGTYDITEKASVTVAVEADYTEIEADYTKIDTLIGEGV